MRSYFNGSGSMVGTPPPLGPGRPLPRPGGSALMMGGARSSSSSLPRSPETDPHHHTASSPGLHLGAAGGGSGSIGTAGGSGHGSLGSHSSHEVSYMNIYQNTNHPHLYVSFCVVFT